MLSLRARGLGRMALGEARVILLGLLGALLLVGLNAFFVAAEFALVAMRPSRVTQLIEEGSGSARVVKELIGDLDGVLSGVQVGITFASLGLGIVGEWALVRLILPLFDWLPPAQAAVLAHSAAITMAFLLLTFLHVVLGELVPKSLALQRTEHIALAVARPLQWFLRAFRWAIWSLDITSQKIVRLLGVADPRSHTLVHSAEELLVLVQQVREHGVLKPREEKFIQGAVELSQLQARELMVPRPDMHTVAVDATIEEVMRTFATTQRSRLPVYEGTLDHILGFLHIKDMVWVLLDRERRAEEGMVVPEFDIRHMLRDVLIVPETKLASDLLGDMRAGRANLAMVVDEFGSILGLVTLEDILEQLVGEIHDEYDVVPQPLTLADGAMVFDASMNVHDLESQYSISLPEDPAYETVSGFVLERLGFLPRGGESFEHDGYRYTVLEVDKRRVARVKVQRIKPVAPPLTETPAARVAAHAPAPAAPEKKPRKTRARKARASEAQARDLKE